MCTALWGWTPAAALIPGLKGFSLLLKTSLEDFDWGLGVEWCWMKMKQADGKGQGVLYWLTELLTNILAMCVLCITYWSTVETKCRLTVGYQIHEEYVAKYQQENKAMFTKSLHIPCGNALMRNVDAYQITGKENNCIYNERFLIPLKRKRNNYHCSVKVPKNNKLATKWGWSFVSEGHIASHG